MATVSDKGCVALAVTLSASVLAAGCASMMPVKQAVKDEASAEQSGERHPQVVQVRDVALPRQIYDRAGAKVPYVAQPNPYTKGGHNVPADARSAFVVAESLLRQGDLKGAQAQFRKLTEKYPALSGAWVKLGEIAEKSEKPEAAMQHYRKAISVNRNNVNAYIALALVQRRQGQFADAQTSYLEALDVWPDFPEAHLNLAILYDLYVNQPEQAQKHYEAYYFLTGENDEKVHKWLVEVRHRTGIERSFIDIPPNGIAEVPPEKAGTPDAMVRSGSPG